MLDTDRIARGGYAGSDCGHVFIYEAKSGRVVRVLDADDDVANCVQAHPVLPVLATSGIESVVDLWSPEGSQEEPALDCSNTLRLIEKNQDRMREGPHSLPVVHPRVLQVLAPSKWISLGLLRACLRDIGECIASGCQRMILAQSACGDDNSSFLMQSVLRLLLGLGKVT